MHDLPGVDPSIITHKMNVIPGSKSVKPKKRPIAPDRKMFVKDEVQKLLDVGTIKEIKYSHWLTNIVLAEQSNGEWRMYGQIKHPLSKRKLPTVSSRPDSRCHLLVQIPILPRCQKWVPPNLHRPRWCTKMAFTTGDAAYYYIHMPFRLKINDCTFQRLMNNVFADQLGCNVEAYVNDVIVKNMTFDDHLEDLKKTSQTIWRYNLRLSQKVFFLCENW